MKTILFTKLLKEQSIDQLITLGKEWGIDGFDLCVRPDYPVNHDNFTEALPEAARRMRAAGLDIPMVTANYDILAPEHPIAIPLLKAMDEADVRFLKLGYFPFKPQTMNYQVEIAKIKATLASWIPFARRFNVKICYHTHSLYNIGLNCAAMAHILENLDPQYIGAYIDPAHLRVNGEPFDYALAMVKPWLSLVALKDVRLDRAEVNGHGKTVNNWLEGGQGMVDWTNVFKCLADIGYDGPVSIHSEYIKPGDPETIQKVQHEVEFFKRFTKPQNAN